MMRTLLLLFSLLSFPLLSQNSKKGFEYTGTKARFSFLGKSKMFSEGVKSYPYSIYWNKKKNILTVNAGPKEKWYAIELSGVDTIHGNVTYIGQLAGAPKSDDPEAIDKSRCEIRFLLDKISIKVGDARLEEYLLDGASVWDDRKTGFPK